MESNILDIFEMEWKEGSIVRFSGTQDKTASTAVFLVNGAVLLLLKTVVSEPDTINLAMLAVNAKHQGKGHSHTVLKAVTQFCDRHKQKLFAQAQLLNLRRDGKGFTKESNEELTRLGGKIGEPIYSYARNLAWAKVLSRKYGFARDDNLYLLREPKK